MLLKQKHTYTHNLLNSYFVNKTSDSVHSELLKVSPYIETVILLQCLQRQLTCCNFKHCVLWKSRVKSDRVFR